MRNIYYLMNKDKNIATMKDIGDEYDSKYELLIYNSSLPIGFTNINDWLKTRTIGTNRRQIKEIVRKFMHNKMDIIIRMTHCVSINDSYWVKPRDEDISWKDVSPYSNKLNELLSIFAVDGLGINRLSFPEPTPELSTGGSFPKCLVNMGNDICMIKRGTDNTAIECYAECLFTDVYEKMASRCVHYSLINYHGKEASLCKIFTNEDIGLISCWDAFKCKEFKKIYECYKSLGDAELFGEMLVADILCLNFDRHLYNHGVLVNNDKQKIISMSPVFDQNLAGLPYLEKEQFREIIEYADSNKEGYYENELNKARYVMTDSIRKKLEQFVDYLLPYESYGSYDVERINLMNHVIRGHARRLLKK